MNQPEDSEKDIQDRQRELIERENAIRLREIEAEIDRGERQKAAEAQIITSKKQATPNSKPKLWNRKLIRIAKFSGFVILMIVLVRIGAWLVTIATIGAIAWVGYKLFLEEDKKRGR